MSFGGHVLDMINRLSQNRAMLKVRSERYKNLRDQYYGVNTPSERHSNLQYRKLTKEERLALKMEIIRLERRDRIIQIVAFIVALIITVSGMYYVLFVK
jgi:uncharacterized protein YdcH (DUF465 family)